MCVYDVSEVEVLEKDLVAYKLVHFQAKGSGLSLCQPSGRVPQKIAGTKEVEFYPKPFGTLLQYTVGVRMESSFETTPGLYCYVTVQDAVKEGKAHLGFAYSKSRIRVMDVLIPAGTKVKKAMSNKGTGASHVVLVEALTPVKMSTKDILFK